MLVRLVRMTLRPDALDAFLAMYDRVSPRIRQRDGCRSLVLLNDVRFPNIVTTHSVWDSEASLDAYRASALFRETWSETKALFAAPAEAWSHDVLRDDPTPGPVRNSG